jgi:hypothetical protein
MRLALAEEELEQALDEYGVAVDGSLDARDNLHALQSKIEDGRAQLASLQTEGGDAQKTAQQARAEAPETEQTIQPEVASPGFAALATYKLKRTKRTGTFTIDLNKYTAGSLSMRFDENIGDLRPYVGNEGLFKSVRLDDPLYVQREISVTVDGLNAEHFDTFVNFVSVLLKKKHQDGSTTNRELTIRRQDFNQSGNDFSMVYGWNGDNNRERWLDYQYRAIWSLFGNVNVEEEWTDWQASAIPLSPPYRPQLITLDVADSQALEDANVRVVRVTLTSLLEGERKAVPVTLVPSRGELSKTAQLLVDPDQPQYEYEIEWVLKGGDRLSSGVRTSTDDLLFVDEIPQ